MKLSKFWLVLYIFFLGNYSCLAQNERDTLNILFVGNSYVHVSNIPHIVSIISDSTNTKLVTSKSTAGGARLSHHWRSERGLKTMEKIKNGNYDIVLLQEQSMGTIEQPDSFLIYSKKFCDYIKENGGKPYFYSTWARQKVPQHQEIITKMYSQAALENDAGIVKIGEAWALAQKLRPNIELYMSDGSHQSSLGALLSAGVVVGTLSKEIPDNLRFWFTVIDERGEEVALMVEDPLDITFCLMVASEITKE